MNVAANIETVKRAYAAFQDRDLPTLLECLADDVNWLSITPIDLCPEETYDDIRINGDAGDDIAHEYQRYEPVEFIGEGSRVVAIGAATDSNGVIGSAVDSSSWVHVFILRNGKICEFHAFYDVDAAVAALASIGRQTQDGLEGIPEVSTRKGHSDEKHSAIY